MKKLIFTLINVVIMVITLIMMAQPIYAQNYITIHYNNGQKPERFYEMDVDSIIYSKIGVDSLVYNDWQVQEIWEKDSVYRIPLSIVDSVSFCNLDNKMMANTFSSMTEVVEPLYMQCETISQIEAHLPTIKAIEGVEDAWVDASTLFVSMKNGGTMVYYYPIDENDESVQNVSHRANQIANDRLLMSDSNGQGEHVFLDAKKICIAYQQYKDEKRGNRWDRLVSLAYDFVNCGFEEKSIGFPNPSISFYNKNIFDYDIVFLITHGHYGEKNKLHWLATDEELFINDETLDSNARKKKWQEAFNKKYNNKYSDDQVFVSAIKEMRRNKEVVVYYATVSEKFIGASNYKFANNTIIFNTSCKSLYGEEKVNGIAHLNSRLAVNFLKKGAGYYLGYTDTDRVGYLAGISLYRTMLNGKSLILAAHQIDPKYLSEDFYHEGKHCTPELVGVSINPDNRGICIIRPETGKYEDLSTEKSIRVKLYGSMKKLEPESTDSYEYGFCVSKPNDETEWVYRADVKPEKFSISYNIVLDDEDIQLGTTYNYRAYLFDGTKYCYGDEEKFKIETLFVNPCPDNNHPHKIDLGLPSGTKWSCCNVGAISPEQNGNYYAWGETITKVYYGSQISYEHFDSDIFIYKDIGSNIAGTSYDVAHVVWGGGWKMPSIEQFRELANYTKARTDRLHGVCVLEIIGNNGAKIVFPFPGYFCQNRYYDKIMRYWSSTADKSNPEWAEMLNFGNGIYYPTIDEYIDTNQILNFDNNGESRWEGLPVRPVWK